MPFQTSPRRDHGYDVSDYYNVDARFGTLGDFVEFTHGAEQRGMRVLIDLVVNHTSDQHPWFQSARADADSPYRDWYVWADEQPPDAEDGIVFPGVQKSTWSFDKKARRWYFHRFYDFQPDLNTAHPMVQAEILKIMGFWTPRRGGLPHGRGAVRHLAEGPRAEEVEARLRHAAQLP